MPRLTPALPRLTGQRFRDLAALAAMLLCVGAASVLAARWVPFLRAAEQWLTDIRIELFAPVQPVHPEIVMVVVTEDTLAQLPYRSPLDRGLLADLLTQLDAAEPLAIGLDILVDQPSEAAKDERIRATMASLRTPLVVAWADGHDGLTPRQQAYLEEMLQGLHPGAVTLLTDPQDGTVRWIYPGRARDDRPIESFPRAVARLAGRAGTPAAAVGRDVPAEAEPLTYRTGPDRRTPAFRSYPAHLVPILPKSWFTGKIVLIGSDLPHIDRHRTPLLMAGGAAGGTRPGVELHAHAVAQILDGVRPAVVRLPVELITVGAVATFAVLTGSLQMPLLSQLAIGVGSFVAFWIAAFALYAQARLLIPIVSPNLAFAMAFALGNAWWHGRTRRQSAFIRQAFSRFTSPAVVRELIRDPDRLRLGGEKREITCLFTDLAGFTGLLERFDPEQTIALLNGYLDGMCSVVFAHDGTLNKIIGDALHVLFNAPLPQPDHAARAVRCALALDAFARTYAARCRADGIAFGDTRIGVHGGIAVVGNFGGDRFFDYTAYGDVVNTAARLEGANKSLGTRVCVSDATASQVPDIPFRPIASVLLVGKQEPIETFEPLAAEAPALSYRAAYTDAYALMRANDAAACDRLRELLLLQPDDALLAFHARRLANGGRGVSVRLAEK